MKKRIVSLLLAMVLVVGLVPQISSTVEAARVIDSGYCGANGENLAWTLYEHGVSYSLDYSLTISGTGAMANYGSQKAPWYTYSYGIHSLSISTDVTTIGDHAFEYCNQLTSVVIPRKVSYVGRSAFEDCSRLTSISIQNSSASIGEGAFENCSSLKSLTLPRGNTCIGAAMFKGCSSLTSITIPTGVTIIDTSAFQGCSSLTSVIIPAEVTTIGLWAFEGCSSLETITIPGGVTTIGSGAFNGCSSLESITIPDGVTYISNELFKGCSSLASAQILGGVTEIGKFAFRDCSALKAIYIPDSVNLIEYCAFEGCNNITDVYYSGTQEEWKQIDGVYAVYGNGALTTATIHCHEHAFNSGIVIEETCTKNGYTIYTCITCGDTCILDETVATGHSHKATATSPTCTNQGYTTYTCTCGDSYKDAYTDALGHAWNGGVITTQPTATTAGVRTYTCTRTDCGATKTEAVPATGTSQPEESTPNTPCNGGSTCPGADFTDMPKPGTGPMPVSTMRYPMACSTV